MSNLPLKALPWSDDAHYETSIVNSALHFYDVVKSDGKFLVRYKLKVSEAPIKEATGFATIDDAKQWAWNHYNEKMQPYVKPSPTKVYELTYDCGDSYLTLFMTTDKQSAIDFMESVKDADQDFISNYGLDDDADELLIEKYNETHPLKPYASKIFDSIYENSFSEWATSYAGNSFVSSLDIIEHELLTSKQGE